MTDLGGRVSKLTHIGLGGAPSATYDERAAEQLTADIALELPDQKPTPGEFTLVPKALAKLSAGGELLPHEGLKPERYAFRRNWLSQVITGVRNAVLLDVDGDSMEPDLETGDTVLIDMGRTDVVNGGIYAIGVAGVAQIKRLEQLPR